VHFLTIPRAWQYYLVEVRPWTWCRFVCSSAWGVQDLIRQKGQTAKPEQLGPRKPGAIIAATPPAGGGSAVPFSGSYRGKWLNARGADFDVEMVLTRQGDTVRGSYAFGLGPGARPISERACSNPTPRGTS
jgi:hypothetical protein